MKPNDHYFQHAGWSIAVANWTKKQLLEVRQVVERHFWFSTARLGATSTHKVVILHQRGLSGAVWASQAWRAKGLPVKIWPFDLRHAGWTTSALISRNFTKEYFWFHLPKVLPDLALAGYCRRTVRKGGPCPKAGLTGCGLKFTVACFIGWKTGQCFRPLVLDSNQGLLKQSEPDIQDPKSPPWIWFRSIHY